MLCRPHVGQPVPLLLGFTCLLFQAEDAALLVVLLQYALGPMAIVMSVLPGQGLEWAGR